MKKIFLFAALFLTTAISRAGFFDSDLPEQTVGVAYRLEVASGTTAPGTSTSTIVIHLASTTGNSSAWRHTHNREINISSIRCQIDKVATSSGSVRLGVVNFVSISSGSITWFYNNSFEKNASNAVPEFVSYDQTFYRTRVNAPANGTITGTTPYLFANNATTGSTTYQTDVVLASPAGPGAVAPGPGDIVMEVVNRDHSNILFVNLTILYHTPEGQ